MKKFAKVSAVILCLAIVATLCACKNSDVATSANNTSLDTVTSSAVSDTTQVQNSSEESSVPSVLSAPSKPQTSSTPSKPSVSSKNTQSSKPQTSSATEKTPAQKIVGKWRANIDMAPLLVEQGIAVEGEQIVSCDVEYTSGGVIYEVIDRTSLKAAYTNIFNKMINDTLTQQNLTKEQFESQMGMTIEEYLAQTVQMSMDMVPQTIISAYKFEGNDLYIRDQDDTDFVKIQYSFSGENKLTIVEDGISVTYTRIG